MIATVPSATLLGVEGRPVVVEVHVSIGLPSFTVVGSPDGACRESRDRVRAAMLCSQLSWPTKRVTVNLAPGGVKKGGPGLDLAVAVALLVAVGEIPEEAVEGHAFLGELGLDGSLRPVPGVVPMVAAMWSPSVVVPVDSAGEAGVLGRHQVRVASNLREVIDCLLNRQPWPDLPPTLAPPAPVSSPDLADIHGQAVGRTAVEIAAAGGHHLLLSGPPGSGKTMLARRLPGLLPELAGEEALDATRIRSAAGMSPPGGGLVVRPPLRAPHHGASFVALIGGGTAWMRPGEVSLAHGGVIVCCISTAAVPTLSGWIVYARISDDPTGQRAGVQRQTADCLAKGERRGLPVDEVIEDNDRSAYTGKPRPGYRRLLALLEAGAAGVIVWHNDRLHRSPAELEEFIAIVERTGAGVVVVEGGDYDLTTPDGRLAARIVGAVARKESEDKSRRLRRKHLDLAEKGLPAGGGRPFGYNITEPWGWEINQVEAGMIREAARTVLEDGASLRGIVRAWDASGVPTTYGKPWNMVGVKRVLTCARVAGLRTHHGQERPAAWPAIIDQATLEELRAVLTNPSRTKNGGTNARKYLLAGMISCGTCGGSMFARPNERGGRGYVCAGLVKGHQCRVMAEPLDDLVRDQVLEALDSPAVVDALSQAAEEGDDSRALATELRGVDERLQQVEDAFYVEATMTKDSYARIKTKLEARQDDLRSQIADQRGHRSLGGLPTGRDALLARWEAADLGWRREVVAHMITRVTIGAARRGLNRFDPSRISVAWREGLEE